MNGARPVGFLDASVLYPALLRDLLMHLALNDLFQPRWSNQVQEEWIAALRRTRPELTVDQLQRTRNLMDTHVSAALVGGFEHRIPELALPDPDDRHVLAAAIEAGASVIVTANLRDFPVATLAAYNIAPQHPDAFIAGLIDDRPDEALAALRQLRLNLRYPPFTAAELLAAMARQGLTASVGLLEQHSRAF